MIEIRGESLLYHLLRRKDFAEKGINFQDLRRLRGAIDSKLDSEKISEMVYVDITTNTLIHALEHYPSFFTRRKDPYIYIFERAADSAGNYSSSEDPSFYICSGTGIPEKVEKKISGLVLEVIRELSTAG